jgi:hypothetical protein
MELEMSGLLQFWLDMVVLNPAITFATCRLKYPSQGPVHGIEMEIMQGRWQTERLVRKAYLKSGVADLPCF